jgi:hypothetical protein
MDKGGDKKRHARIGEAVEVEPVVGIYMLANGEQKKYTNLLTLSRSSCSLGAGAHLKVEEWIRR